jgi:hypothetical protein
MADISTPADFRKMRRLSARFESRTLNGFCFASTFFGPLSFFFYRRLCREDVFQTLRVDGMLVFLPNNLLSFDL